MQEFSPTTSTNGSNNPRKNTTGQRSKNTSASFKRRGRCSLLTSGSPCIWEKIPALPGDGIPSSLSRTTNTYLRDKFLLTNNIDKGEIKRRNRNTFLKQVKCFQTWCEELGIKDPTLGILPPIHKEHIFVSYNLDISQGQNLKNLLRLGVKSVHNYLMAPASHATNNSQRNPVSDTPPLSYPLMASNLSLCWKNSFPTCPSGKTERERLSWSQQLSLEL